MTPGHIVIINTRRAGIMPKGPVRFSSSCTYMHDARCAHTDSSCLAEHRLHVDENLLTKCGLPFQNNMAHTMMHVAAAAVLSGTAQNMQQQSNEKEERETLNECHEDRSSHLLDLDYCVTAQRRQPRSAIQHNSVRMFWMVFHSKKR